MNIDDFSGVQDLVATKRIKKGDEILISYLPANAQGSDVSEIRQQYTKEWYGFECTCQVCNLKVTFYVLLLQEIFFWEFFSLQKYREFDTYVIVSVKHDLTIFLCRISALLCGKTRNYLLPKIIREINPLGTSIYIYSSRTVAFTNFCQKK